MTCRLSSYCNTKESHRLSVFTLNVGSLCNKINEVAFLVQELNYPDVIVLTEVWVCSEDSLFYNLNGYNMHAACNDNYRAGGVFIYTKSDLTAASIRIDMKTADVLRVTLVLDDLTVNIYGFYRSPSGKLKEFLAEFEIFLFALPSSEQTVLTGDFNINIDSLKNTNLQENE